MTLSRLRLYYERPLKAHAIRDWMSAHPRLVIPIVAFLIGTLSYTVSLRRQTSLTAVLRPDPSFLCPISA